MRVSFREYVRRLFSHVWTVVVTGVAGLLGIVQPVAQSFGHNFVIPAWIWLGIFACGFVYAQFQAFHDVRVERDAAVSPKQRPRPKPSAELEEIAADLERLLPEVDDPARYAFLIEESNTLTQQASRILRRTNPKHVKEFTAPTVTPNLADHIRLNITLLRRYSEEFEQEGR